MARPPVGDETMVTFSIRATPAELRLLDAVAQHEERTRADVMRRALRAYAASLGVTAPEPVRTTKRAQRGH